MPIAHFAPAARVGDKALVFLYGMSGSGKTYSGLMIARGLAGPGGKVCAIDTERGRMSVYADDPDVGGFLSWQMPPPYSPAKFVEAMEDAVAAGADVIVIDSLTHEWAGEGGVLEMADRNGAKGLLKWAQPKAQHKRFVKALLGLNVHIVGCMRAKEKYVQRPPEAGKKDEILFAGHTQEQDHRLIFEATVQLFLPNEEPRGVPVIEKCPKTLLPAFPPGEQITAATGARIAAWAMGTAPAEDTATAALRRAAERIAEGGKDALREWWRALVPEDKARLQPHRPTLVSVAEEADARAADEGRGDLSEEAEDPFTGRRDGNPFAHEREDPGRNPFAP